MTELFAVHDAAADRFIDPFCGPTIDFAIRGFKEACMGDGHQFNKFPEDYTLFHIGTFDPQLGTLQGMTARKIATASSFVHGMQLDIEDQIKEQA